MTETPVDRHEVIVGNIGSVYLGNSLKEALEAYASYRRSSQMGIGRGSHEPVTLMTDGEPEKEYFPDEDDKVWDHLDVRRDLEVSNMLTLSTTHFPEEFVNDPDAAPAMVGYDHGFFHYVPDCTGFGKEDWEMERAENPHLFRVFKLARKFGCGMIRADSDGPKVPGLPVYDW